MNLLENGLLKMTGWFSVNAYDPPSSSASGSFTVRYCCLGKGKGVVSCTAVVQPPCIENLHGAGVRLRLSFFTKRVLTVQMVTKG